MAHLHDIEEAQRTRRPSALGPSTLHLFHAEALDPATLALDPSELSPQQQVDFLSAAYHLRNLTGKLELVRHLYSAHSSDLSEEAATCPICLETMRAEDSVMTGCGHFFHTLCAHQSESVSMREHQHWDCPSCRKPVTFLRCEGISSDLTLHHSRFPNGLSSEPGDLSNEEFKRLFNTVPSLSFHVHGLMASGQGQLGSRVHKADGSLDLFPHSSQVEVLKEEVEIEIMRQLIIQENARGLALWDLMNIRATRNAQRRLTLFLLFTFCGLAILVIYQYVQPAG